MNPPISGPLPRGHAGGSIAGGIVGGGAAAGLVVLGAAPGAVSVLIMSHALGDDETLPEEERDARSAGRIASLVGGTGTAVGGVIAVGSLGIPGMSAIGISTGLATIGGVFGGGMAAGAMV